MSGTITVQNIQGPTTGSNANKVLIPSGHTLHAPGHVVQVQESTASADFVTTSTSVVQGPITSTFTLKNSSNKDFFVTKEMYGEKWPFTVDEGAVFCLSLIHI